MNDYSSLDDFCGSRFWDYKEVWNTTSPSFTVCFQQTVLIWIPCGFLWLFSAWEAYCLIRSTSRHIPWTIFNKSKLAISLVLAALSLIELVYFTIRRVQFADKTASVHIYASLILLASFVLVVVVTVLDVRRGIRSSAVLFIFWLLLAITGIVRYWSLFLDISGPEKWHVDLFSFVIYMIFYPLVIAMLVLNCIADSSPKFKGITEPNENPLPENSASFASKVLFIWFDKFAVAGFRRPLQQSDLWSLPTVMLSKNVTATFEKCWKKEKIKQDILKGERRVMEEEVSILPDKKTKKQKTGHRSVIKVLFQVFTVSSLPALFYNLLAIPLEFINPIVLSWLIDFTSGNEPAWKGYLYACILFVAAMLRTFLTTHHHYQVFILGHRIHAALNMAIYKKVLVLSNVGRDSSTAGQITNLMSVDAPKTIELMLWVFIVISAPIQIALASYVLWGILGPATLSGIAVMVLLFPINMYIYKYHAKAQVEQLRLKDERVKIITEVLNGIKVLKLYAWESSFEKQIEKVRGEELQAIKLKSIYNSIGIFIWICAPFLVTLASFGTFVALDEANVLDATKAFVSLSAFNIIRSPISQFPFAFSIMLDWLISIRRIEAFLDKDELREGNIGRQPSDTDAIQVEDGSFAWGATNSAILKNVNLRVAKGHLVAVVGSIGSGKSTLIGALVDEADQLKGRINISGTVAYMSQQAWLANATVQENILFGKKLDDKFYARCLKACSLTQDLSGFPGGDQAEIGEKGINLSGGQKQRISLARAVYSDADIYLLDDPLSAVDAHVGKHIFEEVMGPHGLLKNKTRILVTHGSTFLHRVDSIILLRDGTVAEVGTYQELLDRKGAFVDFMMHSLSYGDDANDDNFKDAEGRVFSTYRSPELQRQFSKESQTHYHELHGSSSKPLLRLASQTSQAESLPLEVMSDRSRTIMKEEKAEVGHVKLAMYMYYGRAMGAALSTAAGLTLVISYAFYFGYNVWLSEWSGDLPLADGSHDIALRNLRLSVYGVLGLGQSLFMLACVLAIAYASLRASVHLHGEMLSTVLRAPMSFFDTTPIGRIVNRFSRDVEVCDLQIPDYLIGMLSCVLEVITTFIIICMATPIFLSVVVPIMAVYYVVQRLYIPTSRQLKRLESNSMSPVYSHFSETIAGVATVRAYSRQDNFVTKAQHGLDGLTACGFHIVTANRWLAIRLEFLGNMVVLFAAIFAVLSRESLDPGLVGLSVTYSMTVTVMLNWAVRLISDLENSVVAVERIKEYVVMPREANWRIESTQPAASWPNRGRVTFDNYATRYRDGLDLVIRGVSCEISSGEKVGIVGRTGAGKSSLTLALFRIVEAARGSIVIDGVQIAKLGLHDLRAKLTIIPQEAVLFAGTLHMNLDPFSDYSDSDIWRVLELSHLKETVSALPLGLQHVISEGGQNLSAGQCQLVCLARALLRKTKILILDEATASVDLKTDDLIQETIRREFADCTVLTIAHRIATIMDSDRIIVLDQGGLKEFDTPSNLLQDRASIFHSMAKEAGFDPVSQTTKA